jgi:hypothetical protein
MPGTPETRRPPWKGVARCACLALIPLVVVALLFWIKAVRGPLWLALNQDPSYHYLLNSLMVAEGRAPFHVDNPGTPLQLMGAVVLHATHLVRGTAWLRLDVLQNPETYLAAIHATLAGLFGAVLLVVGIVSFRITKNLLVALAMQSSPLLAFSTLIVMARVTPEALLASLATLFCLAVVAYLWGPCAGASQKRDMTFAVVFGVLIGLGLATKLTYAPLALAPLVLLPRARPRLLYLPAVVLTFFVATLPTLPNYPRLFGWYARWATHTGMYGGGEPGVFDSGRFGDVLPVLQRSLFLPLIFFAVVIALAWLWRRGRTGPLPERAQRVRRGLLALAVVIVAHVVMILKQPRYHYLVPTLSCLGLGGALLIEASRLWSGRMRRVRTALIVVAVVYLAASRACMVNGWRTALPKITDQYLAVHNEATSKFADAAKVYYYRASAKAYALHVASYRSGDTFADDLRRLYPDSYLWNLWTEECTHFGQVVSLEQIAAGQAEVIFQGEPLDREQRADVPLVLPKGAAIELVYPGKREAIYRLKEILPDPTAPGIIIKPTPPAQDETESPQ